MENFLAEVCCLYRWSRLDALCFTHVWKSRWVVFAINYQTIDRPSYVQHSEVYPFFFGDLRQQSQTQIPQCFIGTGPTGIGVMTVCAACGVSGIIALA